jgi:predicted nucleotidyltransferase
MESASETFTPVIGVVAEYDPFHNGHALHLAKARAALGSAGLHAPVVVTLSSSFTQRGLPALADKTTRARMALANGVSLVLELPFVHACNAGPEFARGAVRLLAATELVTHVAFGVEDALAFSAQKNHLNPPPTLGAALSILIQEPLSFKLNLRENLASGQSYPKALANALERQSPGSGALVSSPNNALAVSYLTNIHRYGLGLIPIPVGREGAGHNDNFSFSPCSPCSPPVLASATAIRRALAEGAQALAEGSWVLDAVPASVPPLLKDDLERGRLCLDTGKLWDLLRGLLTRSTPDDLRACAGMEEGLENLFLKQNLGMH